MNDDSFFGYGSPYLSHPLLTAERTRTEIDFVENVLKLRLGAYVLDIGCGFGRHSVELANRGFRVLGIDPSPAMLEAAHSRAETSAVKVDFRQVRGEEFESDHLFDAAICLFTTLGQVDSAGDNRRLVHQVSRVLKIGGRFVIEVPQREAAVKELRVWDHFGDDEVYTAVSRNYDPKTHRVTEEFLVVNGEARSLFLLRYHLFTRDELDALLQASGFVVEQSYGDYAGSPLTTDRTTMLVVARKDV